MEMREVAAARLSRIAGRAAPPPRRVRPGVRGLVRVDPTQAVVVGALAGDGQLVVVEGAAGAGKTTALRSTQEMLNQQGRRLMVVTPTLKSAEVAVAEGLRGRGIGRRIFLAVEQWFRERGAQRLWLIYLPRNPLSSRFWPSLGFHPVWDRMLARHCTTTIQFTPSGLARPRSISQHHRH